MEGPSQCSREQPPAACLFCSGSTPAGLETLRRGWDRGWPWAGLSFQQTPCVSEWAAEVLAWQAPGLGLSKGWPWVISGLHFFFFFNGHHRVLSVGPVALQLSPVPNTFLVLYPNPPDSFPLLPGFWVYLSLRSKSYDPLHS